MAFSFKEKCGQCEFIRVFQKNLGYTAIQSIRKKSLRSSVVSVYFCSKNQFAPECFMYVEMPASASKMHVSAGTNINSNNSDIKSIDDRVLQIRRLKRRLYGKSHKKEVNKMVERTKQRERLPQIQATVEDVLVETSEFGGESRDQYHVIMKPTSEEGIDYVKGSQTERFHTWIGISPATKDDMIVEGSSLDNYIQCVEAAMPDVKKLRTHGEVMNAMKGHEFLFVLKRIGKTFEGKESRERYVPQLQMDKKRK